MPDASNGQAPRLSAAARMAYWKPDPALAPYISGYHLYAVENDGGERPEDVFFPAWQNLRFNLTPLSGWEVRPPGGDWQSVGAAALFGPSSGITPTRSGSGIAIGFGMRPCGFGHLSNQPAALWANRVGDAAGALRLDLDKLRAELMEAREDGEIPRILDAALLAAIRPEPRLDARILGIEAALVHRDFNRMGHLAEDLKISPRTLQRLAARVFGFQPKLLLRRARFLRSLDAVRQAARGDKAAAIDTSYVDYSHFVKEAHYFLGMSPKAFLALDTPLARQSMALRRQVLGAPVQALSGGD